MGRQLEFDPSRPLGESETEKLLIGDGPQCFRRSRLRLSCCELMWRRVTDVVKCGFTPQEAKVYLALHVVCFLKILKTTLNFKKF